ncbi:MAG: zinc ribbon domain-containing protein [Desulfobacteraceae bacterium]|nr:zinc ribbon domain-containing protein [Desulfobacteraceae bacterium]
MPIHEFSCDDCKHEFEQLILSSDESIPKCPECRNTNVKKLISSGNFRPNGIPTGSGGFKPPACAPSG